jgi:hypothetical protein
MIKKMYSLPCAVIGAALALVQTASATPQPLINVATATTLSKGVFEQENRILWGHSGGSDVLEFSHELEYGVTDKFEVSAYLSEWSWEKGAGSTWGSAGFEGMYAFTNPTTDPLGVAFATEVQIGEDAWVLEPQLHLQKNFGSLSVMANLVFANEFVKHDVDAQEFAQSIGVTYQINPNFFIGVEVEHVAAYEDWKDASHEWYAGPALHYRNNSFWATLGIDFKLSADADDANDFVVGTKFGFLF